MELHIIEYCAQECKRQRSGELSVYDMLNAWDFAQKTSPSGRKEPKRLTLLFIENIGRIVDPIKNEHGFRTVPIFVGNEYEVVEKAPWDRVPDMLTDLLEAYYDNRLFMDETRQQPGRGISKNAEDQFYYEYENIHPFRDGNGRSGKILYNYLKGTLDDPQLPPNFWGISNP